MSFILISLIVVIFKIPLSFWRLVHGGFSFADFYFEALNCLPQLNLIRSTKLLSSNEPAFLPNACYQQYFYFANFVILLYSSHFGSWLNPQPNSTSFLSLSLNSPKICCAKSGLSIYKSIIIPKSVANLETE